MFTMQQNHLKAISNFKANKDTLRCLNGVFVEYCMTETRLCATDGHVLGLLRSTANNHADNGVQSIIIPDDAIAVMLKWKSKTEIIITVETEGAKYRATMGDNAVNFEAVDDTFPNYRRVIPDTVSGLPCQFDPDLLVKFKRASEALFNKPKTNSTGAFITIGHNNNFEKDYGQACVVEIQGAEYFTGVIMPIAVKRADVPKSGPDWARAQLPFCEPVKKAA
jgi:hypothetical protein